jgi:hypothetical protein
MSPAPPRDGFHLFANFPTEIRLAVWRKSLPHRVVELDSQPDDLIWEEPFPCAANWKIQRANKTPPLIAQVCREARAVAFETGRRLPPVPDAHDQDVQHFAMYMVDQPWLDTARDVVHLNWDPTADIEWQSYDWGDPVRCVMAYTAHTSNNKPQQHVSAPSIMLGLLQSFQHRRNPDEPHRHYRWTRSELAQLMRSRASWKVVVLPPVVVHAGAGAATSCLFGLLDDAPVQLVDATDVTRITRFLALADTPDVSIGAGFGLEDLAVAKEELREATRAVFGAEDSAPIMCPTVMFRLCLNKCQ